MAKFQSTDREKVRRPEESAPHADARYEAFQDGGDPADIRAGDGIWRDNNLDQIRAADFGDENHDLALRGPSRFRLTPLDMGDTRFRCRNRPVETTVWHNPAYRVGPPIACR